MRITFRFLDVLPSETLAAHRTANSGRPGLTGARLQRLAIVGGHPNVCEQFDALRDWDGEIWAINGAWRLLHSNGIDATFVSIDPTPYVVDYIAGAKRAILARHCDPRCFDGLDDVEAIDVGAGPGEVLAGPTTATALPHLAAIKGHSEVVFFGCGGSFHGEQSHAYADGVPNPSRLQVDVAGQRFVTDSGLLTQSEWLGAIIKAAPKVFSERSGGLLRALIACPDYDITAATKDIHEALVPL